MTPQFFVTFCQWQRLHHSGLSLGERSAIPAQFRRAKKNDGKRLSGDDPAAYTNDYR
jgi:hypothetical protein